MTWNPDELQKGNLGRIYQGGFQVTNEPQIPADIAFTNTLHDAGFILEDPVVGDGKLHRVRTREDKASKKTGWYVFYMDGIPAGAFGDWRNDISAQWTHNIGRELSEQERAGNLRRMEAAKSAREIERKELQDKTAGKANEIFKQAAPAHPEHAYLVTKRVQAHGLIQQVADGRLVVPLQTAAGEIRNVQYIAGDGEKRFLLGGEKKGCFFQIGDISSANRVYVVEGYATGATVHQATQCAVVVAFDAGNLKPVCEAIRSIRRDIEIIVAGDNDHATEGNPGASKAKAAAEAVNGIAIIPEFSDLDGKPTDWNDLQAQAGINAVVNQLMPAIEMATTRASLWKDRSVKPMEWLVEGFIPMYETTAIYARGGTGKTLFAQQLATAVSAGVSMFGKEITPGPVLCLFCEDDDDALHRRQADINKHLGADWASLSELHISSRVGQDNLLMTFDGKDAGQLTAIWHQFKAKVKEIKPRLVIVDTAADTFGGNENDRSQVRQFVQQALTSIAKENRCAVLLCAHPSLSGINSGEGTGGSTAWENSVRSRLYMDKDKETGRINLMNMKANHGPAGQQIDMHWADGALVEYVDDSPLVMAAKEKEHARIDSDFMMLLHLCHDRQQNISPSPNSQNYAPKLFAQEIGKRKKLKWGRSDYADAMERLYEKGLIKTEKTTNKKAANIVPAGYKNG